MKLRVLLSLLLLIVISAAGILILAHPIKDNLSITLPIYSGSGLSLCLLYGDMRDTQVNSKQGLEALGNMIRIRFDARNVEDCKSLAMSYCQKEIARGYVPGYLGLVIKGNTTSYRYDVSKECVLKDNAEN